MYAACDYGDLEYVRFEGTVQLLPDRMRGRISLVLATRRPAPHAREPSKVSRGPLGGAAAHCVKTLTGAAGGLVGVITGAVVGATVGALIGHRVAIKFEHPTAGTWRETEWRETEKVATPFARAVNP